MFFSINFKGVIASERIILTTANCLESQNLKASNIDVVVGASIHKPIVHKVSYIFKHYSFKGFNVSTANDAAIIVLKNNVDLERSDVKLACLDFGDSKSKENRHGDLLVAGYGITNEANQTLPNSLSYAYFKEKSTSKSNKNFIEVRAVIANETMSKGYFGAPIMVTSENGFTKVLGIASYTGKTFDTNGNPDDAYFTRLSSVHYFTKSYIYDKYCLI